MFVCSDPSNVSSFHVFHQDDVPELTEYFLVNVTSAVLVTTLASIPKLGKEQIKCLFCHCLSLLLLWYIVSLV